MNDDETRSIGRPIYFYFSQTEKQEKTRLHQAAKTGGQKEREERTAEERRQEQQDHQTVARRPVSGPRVLG